jgi:hypothetical protein
MRKDIMTCPSREQFSGMNGGIRDVQWSPTDAVEFAFGTDNGTIQRWDFRQPKGPKQKITAHDQRTCTSIDWHPDGKHLLSASVDKTVKVWDLSIDGRRQKPTFVLTTPYPVHRARWRPPYWSDEYHEKGAYQCTQLATSYDEKHSPIHIWDLRRPYLPFREIHKFNTAPTDMIWHSRDTLWTVGKEGIFQQNDSHLAPKIVSRRNLQALAVSPSGELGAFAQKRPSRRRSAANYSDTYNPRDKQSSPEKGSLRSSADDSLDDSFLSSSSLKKPHGRTASNRLTKSFGSTPPSEAAPKVMFLTDSMVIHSHSFKPNQVAIRGMLPGATNVQVFAYLAQKYKVLPFADLPTVQSFLNMERLFEHNAQMAQRAAFYRISETWRIIGQTITVAIKRRAELHRNHRQIAHTASTSAPSAPSHHRPQSVPIKFKANEDHSVLPNPALRAILDRPHPPQVSSQHLTSIESTSNLATPLARPLTTSASQSLHNLPDPDHADELSLPPAVAGPHSSENSALLFPKSVNQSLAHFNSPNWYQSSDDLDERRALIGSWRAPPRAPLNLEPTNAQGINISIPPRLDRHDSDESFAMFSASTDSQRGTSMPSSFASGKSQSRSSFGKPRLSPSNQNVDQFIAMDDSLGKSMQISPTTVPIDDLQKRPIVPMQQGSVRDMSDDSAAYSSKEKAVQDIEILRRNNQLLRHDSSESEAYTSSGGEMSTTSMNPSSDMEASGTIVPETDEEVRSPKVSKSHGAMLHDAPEVALPVLEPTAEDPLNLSDFQAMHVQAEEGLAFAVIGLLNSNLDFLTSTGSDAQTSSTLLLLLTPLLPRIQNGTKPYGVDTAEALSAFGDAFATLGFSPTQIETVASTHLTPLLATGINPYQAEAILHTYHAQLHSLSLFNSTASLRRLAYPMYPAVYEQGLKDTQLGLLCLSCKSPINNPKDKMRCETCKRAQAPCPICWGRYPAFESIAAKKKGRSKTRSSFKDRGYFMKRSSLVSVPLPGACNELDSLSPSVPEQLVSPQASLWTWCPLCGHGGHTNCLSTWFMDPILSEGACATEGCLCDCVAGSRRERKIKELLAKKAEKEKSKVVRKGDDWKVHESKAVSAVRGALGDAAAPVRDPTQPGGTTIAPGLPTGRKDDGRRVRVVDPQDTSIPQHLPSQNSTSGKKPKH